MLKKVPKVTLCVAAGGNVTGNVCVTYFSLSHITLLLSITYGIHKTHSQIFFCKGKVFLTVAMELFVTGKTGVIGN